MFTYICLTRTIQIHQLSLSSPDSFAFKPNINRNLFVRSLKIAISLFVSVGIVVPPNIYKQEGKAFPSLPSQVAPRIAPASSAILSALLTCPLPLLRAQAPPATLALTYFK